MNIAAIVDGDGERRGSESRDVFTVGDLRRDDIPMLEWSGSTAHLENVARQLDRCVAGAVDYLVIRDSRGAPVAKGAVDYEETPGAGTIFQVATRPDLEGHGLATRLIADAERRIVARGLSLARIAVEPDNKRAVRLYEHLGFRAIGERQTGWEREYADGVRRFYSTVVVDMEKALTPWER